MKRILALAAILLALGAGVWVWRVRAPAPTPDWTGYAEADYVDVSPTLTGRLTALGVARGDRVTAGQLLFTQDDVDDRAALAGARSQLAQARAKLADLRQPRRPMEIAQAAANLAQQQAARDKIAGDLARDLALVGHGFVTQQQVARERADLAAADAAVQAAQTSLTLAHEPIGRADAIAAQRAAVDAAAAAVRQAQWRLAQRRVTAPVAGVVAETDALKGETVTAGATVVRLLPPANIRVRFFVPEPALATIHYGETVAISCDNCGPGLTARVSYIAPQTEYTPPVIYSRQTRATLVTMIEARPPPAEALRLKPGQPVEVRPLNPAPSS